MLLALPPALAQQDPEKRGGPEAGKDNPAARAAWFLRGRTVPGKSAAELLYRAHQQKLQIRQQTLERLRRKAARMSQTAPGTTSDTSPASGATTATAPAGGQPMTVPTGPAWVNLGPAPITGMGPYGNASGRITAVVVDQTDSTGNTVLVAGAYGGVWKSVNAANADPTQVTWAPLFDTDPAAATLSVGAIALQPGNPNLILVGTGEAHNAIDSYYGMGILRSDNGGASWALITSADSGAHPFRGLGFAKIAFSTANTNLVVAAAGGTIGQGLGAEAPGACPAANSTCRGLYFSTDAGATWQYATVKDGTTTTVPGSATSVVYNATAGKFFAAIRFHGFYSSTDGQNWSRLTNQPGSALSTTACPATSGSTLCPIFRGELTVKPGANETYAWYMNISATGTLTNRGVFRTLDGASTAWVTVTGTGLTSCGDPSGCIPSQIFYNMHIAAVPNGANTDLYAGGVNIFKCSLPSTGTLNLCNQLSPSANRWINLTHVYGFLGFGGSCSNSYLTIHPDQHAADFSQSNPQIMYFGNDGGAYRTLTSRTGLVNGNCTATSSNPFDDLNTSS
ncbi:MAG: WD40/YVTN/BNR-like repeat-containing protein, partial [Terriglobales bacterium]